MNDYLSKPIRVNQLTAALSRGAEEIRRRGAEEQGGRGAGEQESKGAEEQEHEVEALIVEKPSEIQNPATGTQAKSKIQNLLDPAALETLLEVIGGEQELLVELIDSFLETAPPLLARLRQGVEQGNAAEVRAAAHILKATGNDFGATRLADLCQQLEERGKAGRLEEAAELAAQVEAEYEQVKAALETEKEKKDE
jgi:HPt (histidine-containing phosphotransfer) domain-containing protein